VPATSAGILLYRNGADGVEVLIVHPGGPFFSRRDEGVWSLPKGEYTDEEEPYAAARREFTEEVGSPPPDGEALDLGEVRLKSGKRVRGFALAGDLDADAIVSNTFELEWPPRSGRTITIPEVDRAAWCAPALARERLNPAQAAFVDRLLAALSGSGGPVTANEQRPISGGGQ
jgi:predicted NUDIX family NTP pyrophosphohydrolase